MTTTIARPAPQTLAQFIEIYQNAITKKVIETYQPQYTPQERDEPLPELLRQPLGAQEHAIRATAQSLRTNHGTTIVGEMGTGKTYIAIAAAQMANFRRPIIICPPHLVPKWKREVEITLPGVRALTVSSITQLETIRKADPRHPFFTIISREQAKRTYFWKPAFLERPVRTRRGNGIRDEEGNLLYRLACPECGEQPMTIQKDEVKILTPEDLEAKRRRCQDCGGALWTADRERNRKYALADYITRRMKGFFDLLICDEVHEYKGKNTAQGISAGNLATTCGQSLALTGTLMGGYASTIFHLLYRFSPNIRAKYGYNQVGKWIDDYGFRERRTKNRKDKDQEELIADGRASRSRQAKTRISEIPGIAPAALMHIIGNTLFLRLSDVAAGLPPYDEEVITVPMDQEIDPDFGISQHSGYQKVLEEMKKAIGATIREGSNRMLGQYLQSLTAYPDACINGETAYDPETGELIVAVPPLQEDRLYPKEKALQERALQEVQQGRRIIVYVSHTDTRDLTPRIQEVLERAGIRTAVLKSTSSKAENRELWVEKQLQRGVQALICNPKLVQTGLDLVEFPTIIWYQQDYSTYTMRQASRRSWRIGQQNPVHVVFMAYQNTVQTEALRLIAGKMQSSLAIEGELPKDGLAAYSNNADSIVLTLARQIIEDGADDWRSIDQIFQETKKVEAHDQQFLGEVRWDAPLAAQNPPPPRTRTPQEIIRLEASLSVQPARKETRKPSQEGMTLFDWAAGNSQ